jgi:hypothetical protein
MTFAAGISLGIILGTFLALRWFYCACMGLQFPDRKFHLFRFWLNPKKEDL